MGIAAKTMGQVKPSAATLTTAYTVPGSTNAVINIYAAEQGGSATTIRIAIRVAGASIDDKHYIAYDMAIAANETITFDGIALAATDVVSVYANDATVSFNVTGLETS